MRDIDGLSPDIRLDGDPPAFLKVFPAPVLDRRGIEKFHSTGVGLVRDHQWKIEHTDLALHHHALVLRGDFIHVGDVAEKVGEAEKPGGGKHLDHRSQGFLKKKIPRLQVNGIGVSDNPLGVFEFRPVPD